MGIVFVVVTSVLSRVFVVDVVVRLFVCRVASSTSCVYTTRRSTYTRRRPRTQTHDDVVWVSSTSCVCVVNRPDDTQSRRHRRDDVECVCSRRCRRVCMCVVCVVDFVCIHKTTSKTTQIRRRKTTSTTKETHTNRTMSCMCRRLIRCVCVCVVDVGRVVVDFVSV